MIIILSIVTGLTLVYCIGLSFRVQELNRTIIELDKEQHTQNSDIVNLIKYAEESSTIITDHSKAIMFMVEGKVEKDVLGKYYDHIKGEA